MAAVSEPTHTTDNVAHARAPSADPPLSPPFFDPTALRVELTTYWRDAGENPTKARPAVLARLKEVQKSARQAAEARLLANGDGRACAAELSQYQDELICLILDYVTTHIYRARNPSQSERMAIIATGGYGRGLLAPASDIDLLFLLPYKQTAWGESVVEATLYLLWDLGLKVGHATRTVEQCIKLSRSDYTIRTAMLDARLILGNEDLFNDLMARFRAEVVRGTGRAFVAEKLRERQARLNRAGDSRYLVEPNIKEGKGGMRDLHLLHWLILYLHDEELQEARLDGLFTPSDYHVYRKSEDFLWAVRCHLHFLTGRAEERLSFDVQQDMAERLGYRPDPGLRPVERFMKHYFLVAKEVGDLTRVVSAGLELRQLKVAPTLSEIVMPLTWRRRLALKNRTDFKIENGRLMLQTPQAFESDPINLLRLFNFVQRHNVALHPSVVRRLRQSLRLIDDKLREDKTTNAIFLQLLTNPVACEPVLRRMNETGVLGRFIPDFGRIVAMMQFNMYHHYTVDEHLIQTVGIIAKIELGNLEEDHPLATEIFPHVQNSRLLYVTALLHDIAKGRDEDHSIAGAAVAREICPRLGLSANETELVAWLIEEHLTMSSFAQSRDLNDPKTIRDFAEVVQSRERLRLLLILTIADIRAVGPGVWTGWKGQLLRQLYYDTELLLTGGHASQSRETRVGAAINTFRDGMLALANNSPNVGWSETDVEDIIVLHEPAYWLRTEFDEQRRDADLIRQSRHSDTPINTVITTDAFTAITELTILTQSHPSLLAAMAGACSAAGADIISAQIYTARDGMAIDTFRLQRFSDDADEERRAARIVELIDKTLRGDLTSGSPVTRRNFRQSRIEVFSVKPDITIDNTLSHDFSVVEVAGRDRPGLLHDVTRTLSDLKLDINSAHITTFGERVVDVFYVTDLTGNKVVTADRHQAIREQLLDVLDDADA